MVVLLDDDAVALVGGMILAFKRLDYWWSLPRWCIMFFMNQHHGDHLVIS
jgi:hypothetical protein